MKYFILIVSLTWFICFLQKQQRSGTNENCNGKCNNTHRCANEKCSKIKAGKIEQRSFSSILKVNGRIDVPPQNMVSVSVPLGGYLKSTKLLPGMHINKNEVIAVIEDQQYIQLQQDYLVAKAQFGFHESEYNRQKELNQSKASSDKVFEQAKSTYQTQRVLIKSLEEKLKLLRH